MPGQRLQNSRQGGMELHRRAWRHLGARTSTGSASQAAITPIGMQFAQAFDVFVGHMRAPNQARAKAGPRLRRQQLRCPRRLHQIRKRHLPHDVVTHRLPKGPAPKLAETCATSKLKAPVTASSACAAAV